MPLIVILSVVGAYSINNSLIDVWWMMAFGILGYFMRQYRYPIAPVILGVILSDLMDQNWRRAMLSEQDSLTGLLHGIFTSPLSTVLVLLIVMTFASQTGLWRKLRTR